MLETSMGSGGRIISCAVKIFLNVQNASTVSQKYWSKTDWKINFRNWKEVRAPVAMSMMMAIKNVGRFVFRTTATVIYQHLTVDQTPKH